MAKKPKYFMLIKISQYEDAAICHQIQTLNSWLDDDDIEGSNDRRIELIHEWMRMAKPGDCLECTDINEYFICLGHNYKVSELNPVKPITNYEIVDPDDEEPEPDDYEDEDDEETEQEDERPRKIPTSRRLREKQAKRRKK